MKVSIFFRRLSFLVLAAAVSISFSQTVAAAKDTKLHSAIEPVSHNEKSWWKKRHEMMNKRVAQGNFDMLLIGDSITHAWESDGKEVWKEYYGPRNAVNLGIGGDRTQNVLWRLDNGNIDCISPKLAMVMIGTNNSADNSPQEIAEGVKLIVEKLRVKLPQTKILLLAIFPRGPNKDDARRQVNIETNKIIASLDDSDMIQFLDIGDHFLNPDGTLSKEIMPDLLHLSPKGYTIWAEAVETAVEKVMGPVKKQQPPVDGDDFVSLFDGKSLAGWRKAGGGATYCVEDGCIVGKVGPGRNTFLCTKKNYSDFILKLDVKLDVPGNSGIQIRSHQREEDGEIVVYGYQCEIDPSDRAWSGGIYDESRNGWLYDLEKNPEARKAFNLKDWNHVVIKAEGPSIKTWINGVACADLIDATDTEGFIALQVHAGEKGQIRWRNIRIKELCK